MASRTSSRSTAARTRATSRCDFRSTSCRSSVERCRSSRTAADDMVRFLFLVPTAVLLLGASIGALDGQPGMHDPSTVAVEDGKYYVYATRGGLPIAVSDDGWTWRRAGTLMPALPGGRPGADVIAR